MMEAHDARYIKDENFVRTISIPTLGIGTTEFDISTDRSRLLCQSGREAAEDFFTSWDFTEYVEKYRRQKKPVTRGRYLRSGKLD
ncbi:hypothetical protein ACFLYF_06015 [Chloroflexota bacterium]